MNEKRAPEGSDEGFARLLRAAGPRVMPDAERAARARHVVHGEWQSVLAARRTRRWLAAAVVAVIAIGLGLFSALRPAPPIAVATVVRVSGEVMRRVEGRRSSEALVGGVTLRVGESIETSAAGRALVRWSDSTVLRFDAGSSARLDSANRLRLSRGAVYVETNEEEQGPGLAFRTPLGEVRHLGTRFEVRVEPGNVRVRVRDGLAIFASSDFAPVIVEAGRQLVVAGGSASLQQGPDASDPEWNWTQSIGPTFAIEGRSLFDAVEWLAHEAGLRVIYASPAVRERTRGVILHGSIEGLDLEQALTAVLSGSGATFTLRRDRIEIREAGPR